jgi:hypothetical protein
MSSACQVKKSKVIVTLNSDFFYVEMSLLYRTKKEELDAPWTALVRSKLVILLMWIVDCIEIMQLLYSIGNVFFYLKKLSRLKLYIKFYLHTAFQDQCS